MTSDFNGHVPTELVAAVDQVAGDTEELEYQPDLTIYARGEFLGGDPKATRVREVSVTIPVSPTEDYTVYAPIVETAVREIGRLGALPGYTDKIDVTLPSDGS